MNLIDKKAFIQDNLDRVEEPVLDEIYQKMIFFIQDSLMDESEDDIKKGNLTNHETLKKEAKLWRYTK
jgi:hypothetical protein